MQLTRIGGALLILLGLVVNWWTLEIFVVPDGSIGSTKRSAVVTAQLALISLGIWFLIKAPRIAMPSAANCIVLMASTMVGLGMAEMALRIIQPNQKPNPPAYVGQFENRPSKNFEIDADTGWRMRKNHEFEWRIEGHLNTYRSNGQGFRSNRDFDHSSKGLIAITGDSMTWGTGVDYGETFGDLLELQVAGSQVFNFAMPGFGLDQMWMSVRHQMLPLKPALIIVTFIDEDLNRSLTAYRRVEGFNKPRFVVDVFGNLRPQTSADIPNSLVLKIQSGSRLWRAASQPVRRLRPFSEWWTVNTAILEAIASDCERQQVPLLFVRLPARPLERFASLDRFLRRKGFEFLNLGTPEIPDGLHFEKDGHINAKGHQFAAAKIAEWIEKRLPQMVRAEANRLEQTR